MPNEQQIDFWNGVAGDRWVAAQQRMDATIRPLGEAAMDAASLGRGDRVLDVGCGCGDTTVALAERVGPANVVGVDVSAPMLARARQRAPDLDFRLGDAATVALPAVDVVFSRFGVMFFDDPVGAFSHLRTALRPGGRLSFVCWRPMPENPWAALPLEAVGEVLGPAEPPPPGAPGPFSFAREERIREVLSGAGFADVGVSPFDQVVRWTDSADPAEVREAFVQIGPAARRLPDATPALREVAIARILERLRPFLGAGGLRMPAAVWVVTARNGA